MIEVTEERKKLLKDDMQLNILETMKRGVQNERTEV